MAGTFLHDEARAIVLNGQGASRRTYVRDIANQIVEAGQQKDNEKAEKLADKLTEHRSSSGSFAMFAAILRASSLVSNFAADRR